MESYRNRFSKDKEDTKKYDNLLLGGANKKNLVAMSTGLEHHDHMSHNMVKMASTLKQTSLSTQSTIASDNKILDTNLDYASRYGDKLTIENRELSSYSTASSRSLCWVLFWLIISLLMFVWTFIIIKSF